MNKHYTNTDNPIDFPDLKLQKAIHFIAGFYEVSEEVAKTLYADEVESYLWLLNKQALQLK